MPSPPLLSPYLQTRRFQAAKPYLSGDVLDLGCGQAELAGWLGPGQTYLGIEGNLDRVAWLQSMFPTLDFLARDLDCDLLGLDRKFDTITMIAVIEHLKNPFFLLRQLPDLLSPGGNLVITTPSPVGDRIHRIGARIGLFSMIAVEDHSAIYSKNSLTGLLFECGFRFIRFRRFLWGGNQLVVCRTIQDEASRK